MFKAFKQYNIQPLPRRPANSTAISKQWPCAPVDLLSPPEEWRKVKRDGPAAEQFPALI